MNIRPDVRNVVTVVLLAALSAVAGGARWTRAAVSLVGTAPQLLVVHPGVAAKSVPELIQVAKASVFWGA